VASHRIEGSELIPKRVTKSSFRREIIDTWGGCCAYCGCEPEKITLDHVTPKAKGGTTDRANLVPACAECNVSKNHCDVWAWYHAQPFHTTAREERIRSWLAPD
jgi:5-methylcytosine-specific restriction endonuclease McrA